MEELIGLLAPMFIVVIPLIASVSKNAQKKQQQEQQRLQAAWQQANANRAQAQPAAPARPAQPLQPMQPTVVQPTVHTHLQPDCETHDAPASGSLNVVSPEGKDPCHQEQLPQRRAQEQEPEVEQPHLTLDFSGERLVQAFVMQEVLTRPCDRRR